MYELTMKYELVKQTRGRETVVMTGDMSKVRHRMHQLRASQRRGIGRNKDRVAYFIRETPTVRIKLEGS